MITVFRCSRLGYVPLLFFVLCLSSFSKSNASFVTKTYLTVKQSLLTQVKDLSLTDLSRQKDASLSDNSDKADSTPPRPLNKLKSGKTRQANPLCATIGDYVWKDCESNGVQDPDEEGVVNVPVNLAGTDINGLQVDLNTLTDSFGLYLFEDLIPGTYVLTFGMPAGVTGLEFVAQNQGGDDNLDSDADPLTGETSPISVIAGDNVTDIDAGFNDTERPEPVDFINPLLISCTDTIPNLLFTDNCDDTLQFIVNDNQIMFFTDSCEMRIRRSWLVSDDCGNLNSVEQVVIKRDTTAPEVITGLPDTLVLCPDDPIFDTEPVFTDDCDLFLDISFTEGNVPVSDCEYQVQRFWRATDNCGNEAEVFQIITVKDTAAVTVVSEPAPVTFACSLGALERPEIMNSCGDNIPLEVDTVFNPGICDNQFTAFVNYTSADECYEYNFTHEVSVIDTTAPVLVGNAPEDIILECGGDIPDFTLEFTDNCGSEVTQTYSETENDLACGRQLIQSITASDICGNELTVTRTVTLDDSTVPILSSLPGDITIDCGDAIPTPPTLTSIDLCESTVPVDFSETTMNQVCGGTYELMRTWTAEDGCGNTVATTQVITITDTEAPLITGVPEDLTVECTLPGLPTVSAEDECGTATLSFSQSTPTDTCQTHQVVRTWTTNDDCGNEVSASYTITVEITGPNIADTSPEELVFECDEDIPDPVEPEFTPGCYDADITGLTETQVPGACPQEYEILREWAVEDACGNNFTLTQTVIVVDTTAPVLTITEPLLQGFSDGDTIYLECDAMIELNENGATATDNCDDNPVVMFMEFQGEQGDCLEDGYLSHMICGWKADDACGNRSQIMLNFFIIDSTPPMLFGVPNDITVDCLFDTTPPIVGAMDNCDFSVQAEMTETISGDDCLQTIIRIWTVEDHCGNVTSAQQTITIADEEPPVLSPLPPDLNVTCGNVPPPVEVTANDDCSDEMPISFTETTSGNVCTGQTTTRTWSVSDDCGNTAVHTQTITVTDLSDPVLTGVPADVTVACGEIPPVPTVSASDDCDDDLSVIFNQAETGSVCSELRITRTWSVSDDCGNMTLETQIITVRDNSAPTLSGVPEDITINCTDIPAPANVSAQDDCDEDLSVDLTETVSGEECNSRIVTRVWSVTDDCGNTTSATQIININDDTAPVLIGVPNDITVTCDDIPPPAVVTTQDDCDDSLNIQFSEIMTGGPCTDRVISRTWTVTDDCGNTASATQVISINDNTAPVLIGVPNDITVSCDALPPPANLSVEDDCQDDLNIQFSETMTGDICTGRTIVRNWSVTDDCGNNTTASQTITVIDNTPPTLSGVPADISIECDEVPTPPTVTATDNCDDTVVLEYSEQQIPGACPQSFFLIRTWRAMDDCGNEVTATQTVSVSDTEAPLITPIDPILQGVANGDTLTFECMPEIFNENDVSVEDNCDPDATVEFTELNSGETCPLLLTCTWIASDACGNQSQFRVFIRVEDTSPPVFTELPTAMVTECSEVPSPEDLEATDNCGGEVIITFEDNVSGEDCTNLQIIRTYSATDDCGNTTTASQVIVVSDNEAPVLNGVPDDIMVECSEVPDLPTVTATDDCATAIVVEVSETITPGDCPQEYTIIRTWSAVDLCGNEVTASQTIMVKDTTPPLILNVPQDISVNCDDIPEPPVIDDDIKAVDLCAPVSTLTLEEELVGETCEDLQLIRTWTASDECGNMSTASQVITLTDDTPPVFTGIPQDQTFECEEGDLGELPTATDNCDDEVEVTVQQSQVNLSCGYVLIRVFTATDDCGNTASVSQNITVTDDEAPVILNVPADITLSCDDEITNANNVTAIDNCSEVTLTFEESTEPFGDCPFNLIITRVWTAVDDCGNTATAIQIITIIDDTAPTLTFNDPLLADLMNGDTLFLECGSQFPNMEALAIVTDDCDDNPDVEFTEETEVSEDCLAAGYLVKLLCTWTLSDLCGNEAVFEITVIIQDTQAPVIDCPEDITVDLAVGETIPDPAEVTATDNCTNEVTFTFSETQVDDADSCGYSLVRIWIATDDCGNNMLCSQDVRVEEFCDCPEVIVQDTLLSPVSCAGNDGSIELSIENAAAYNYLWVPNFGTSNSVGNGRSDLPAGEYLIVITQDDLPDCETKVYLRVEDACADCTQDIFAQSTYDIEVPDCADLAPICINITESSISNYDITQNGSPYTGSFVGCSYDTTYSYSTAAIPSGGFSGPYTVTEWNLNGQTFTGEFNNINDLLDSLNTWDSIGDWQLGGGAIVGGSTLNAYGNMAVFQNNTGASAVLVANQGTVAVGLAVEAPVGTSEFIFINNQTACADTATVTVTCPVNFNAIDLPVAIDDEITLTEGQIAEIDVCLNDIFNGELTGHYLNQLPESGTAIIEENLVRYAPQEGDCEEVSFTYEICNDLGCDEAEVIIHYLCDELSIFTGFSPNDDGINDAFTVIGLARYPQHHLQIYNRWGSRVYESSDYQNDWKGSQAGQDLPDGTYFYLLDTGEGRIFSGFVELNR